MKKTYSHSEEFYDKKYKQLKEWAKEVGAEDVLEVHVKNKNKFIQFYETIKNKGYQNVDKALKYKLFYNTDYNTALAQYNIVKEVTGDEEVRLKDFKQMKHKEFVELYEDEINEYYASLTAKGLTSKEAQWYISRNFFGSK